MVNLMSGEILNRLSQVCVCVCGCESICHILQKPLYLVNLLRHFHPERMFMAMKNV